MLTWTENGVGVHIGKGGGADCTLIKMGEGEIRHVGVVWLG